MKKHTIWLMTAIIIILGVTLAITQQQFKTVREIYSDVYDAANFRLMTTPWAGAQGAMYTEEEVLNGSYDAANHRLRTSGGSGGGSGDVSSNTSTATNNEFVLFSGTDGKTVKRGSTVLTTNGLVTSTNGVPGIAVAGTDYVIPGSNVATATALAADPANGPAGTLCSGIAANGTAQGCITLSATNTQSATYQVLTTDFDNYKTILVPSGTFTITLVPSATQPADGKYITIINYGSGVVTIAPSSQNINGAATPLTLPAATSTTPTSSRIVSSGTNYFATLANIVSGGGGGTGDLSSNTSTSTDNELALFSGTNGKLIKRGSATLLTNGLMKSTSGVPSIAVAGTDYATASGNNATGFFNAGQIPPARGGLGVDASAYTGVGRWASGNYSSSEISGDCTTSGSNVITCTKMNNIVPGMVNPQSGTYQVLAADFLGYKTIVVSSGTFTITLVASGTQPVNGLHINIINYGTGVVTVARSGQNINAAASNLTLPAGSATAPTGARVVSDGSNYFASLYGAGGGGAGSGTVSSGTDTFAARYNGTGTTVNGSSALTMSATALLSENHAVTNITTSTTLSIHNVITCTTGSNTLVVTLPSAASSTVSRYTVIKDDTGSGKCDITRAGSDTINGAVGPVSLTTQWSSVTVDLVNTGSPGNWYATIAKAQLGYVQLPVSGAKVTGANPAILAYDESRPKLVFDAATSWCATWTFQLNPDYGTVPTILYTYSMASDSNTAHSAIMVWSVWKTTNAEAVDAEIESYGAVNTCTDSAIPSSPGRIKQISCALTNDDGMVLNDIVTLKGCRNISGTSTGNLEILGAQLQYVKN